MPAHIFKAADGSYVYAVHTPKPNIGRLNTPGCDRVCIKNQGRKSHVVLSSPVQVGQQDVRISEQPLLEWINYVEWQHIQFP